MTTSIAMKMGAAILLLVSAALAADSPAAKPSTSLRVMSFNVRNSHEDDGVNGWPFRKGLFFQTINAFKPDLIGFQEVLADQHDDIAAQMHGYSMAGVARDDGKRAGEWSLIAFRTDRFEKLDAGNFWLSEHPDQPGSRSWDAACTRICSWVRLRDRSTQRELLYANTHWDHVGKIARRNAAEMIKQRLPALSAGAPVILTGDLNSTEDDDWVQSLLHPTDAGQVQLIDSYRETHPQRSPNERTFHAFTGIIDGSRINFILHGKEFTATASEIDRNKSAQGRYPSDHFAVNAVLIWK